MKIIDLIFSHPVKRERGKYRALKRQNVFLLTLEVNYKVKLTYLNYDHVHFSLTYIFIREKIWQPCYFSARLQIIRIRPPLPPRLCHRLHFKERGFISIFSFFLLRLVTAAQVIHFLLALLTLHCRQVLNGISY